jgi:ornithine carrier protein
MEKPEELHPLKEVLFGAAAGMNGKLVEHPFDTVKVRLQSFPNSTTSTWKMIGDTYRHEGIKHGFYKGLRAPMFGACLETSVLFTGYGIAANVFMKQFHCSEQDSIPFWSKCVSGGFAGFLASFALTPVELVKCQLQVSNLSKSSTSISYSHLMQQILESNGILGFWHGWSSTCLREIVGTSIWFGSYEFAVDYLHGHVNNDVSLLISGAFAGLMFNLSAFPVDTIKSNIQTYELLNGKLAHKIGFTFVVKKLFESGGIKSFYNGLGITLVRAMPANALIFYTYDVLKRTFP